MTLRYKAAYAKAVIRVKAVAAAAQTGSPRAQRLMTLWTSIHQARQEREAAVRAPSALRNGALAVGFGAALNVVAVLAWRLGYAPESVTAALFAVSAVVGVLGAGQLNAVLRVRRAASSGG